MVCLLLLLTVGQVGRYMGGMPKVSSANKLGTVCMHCGFPLPGAVCGELLRLASAWQAAAPAYKARCDVCASQMPWWQLSHGTCTSLWPCCCAIFNLMFKQFICSAQQLPVRPSVCLLTCVGVHMPYSICTTCLQPSHCMILELSCLRPAPSSIASSF
jgi:hypothetical protein